MMPFCFRSAIRVRKVPKSPAGVGLHVVFRVEEMLLHTAFIHGWLSASELNAMVIGPECPPAALSSARAFFGLYVQREPQPLPSTPSRPGAAQSVAARPAPATLRM